MRTDMLDLRPELAAGPKEAPEDLALAAAVLCQAVAPAGAAAGGVSGSAGGSRSTAVWQELGDFRLMGGA
jgi:hypothetical protein